MKHPSLSYSEITFIDSLPEPTPDPNNPHQFQCIPLHNANVPKSHLPSRTGYCYNDKNYGFEIRKTWRTNREGIIYQAVKSNRWEWEDQFNVEYDPESTWEVFYPEYKTKKGNYIYNPDRFVLANCDYKVQEASMDSVSCFVPYDNVPTKLEIDGPEFENSQFNKDMTWNMQTKKNDLAEGLNSHLDTVPTGLKNRKHSGPIYFHRCKLYGGKNEFYETLQKNDETQKMVNRTIISTRTSVQNFATDHVIRRKTSENGFTTGPEQKLKIREGNTLFGRLTKNDRTITMFNKPDRKNNYLDDDDEEEEEESNSVLRLLLRLKSFCF